MSLLFRSLKIINDRCNPCASLAGAFHFVMSITNYVDCFRMSIYLGVIIGRTQRAPRAFTKVNISWSDAIIRLQLIPMW